MTAKETLELLDQALEFFKDYDKMLDAIDTVTGLVDGYYRHKEDALDAAKVWERRLIHPMRVKNIPARDRLFLGANTLMRGWS